MKKNWCKTKLNIKNEKNIKNWCKKQKIGEKNKKNWLKNKNKLCIKAKTW